MVLCAVQDRQWYLRFRLALQFFCFFTTEVNFYLNEPPPPTVDSQWGSYSGERERGASEPPACTLHRQERPLHTTAHEMVLELKYEKETKVGLWQQRCEAFLYNSKIRSHVVYYERLAPF